MGGIYVSRKTPHCREIGELRKGATARGAKRISKRRTLIRRQATFKLAVGWADEIAANS